MNTVAIENSHFQLQVSEGAELIMLSKSVFTKYATEPCKKFVREKVRRYPEEEKLQESLQDKINWDMYKKGIISDFVTQKQAIKLLQAKVTSQI